MEYDLNRSPVSVLQRLFSCRSCILYILACVSFKLQLVGLSRPPYHNVILPFLSLLPQLAIIRKKIFSSLFFFVVVLEETTSSDCARSNRSPSKSEAAADNRRSGVEVVPGCCCCCCCSLVYNNRTDVVKCSCSRTPRKKTKKQTRISGVRRRDVKTKFHSATIRLCE